ncbi:MAG: glutamine synthetase family protein [Pseudomonadota bacterium]
MVARYGAQDLTPVSAVELEFYVFDQQGRAPGGLADEGVLDLADLDRLEPFLAELEARCGEIGLTTGAALSEGGGGQVEVNLPHSPDPLEVADHAMMFRQVVRGVAQSQGLRVTFMALPKLDAPGNGQHVHLSVLDGNGANIFDNGAEQGTQALRHAIGGVLAQMPDAALLFAPHGNSHRRLHNGFAPSTVAWAYDSRFAAVRVPSGPPPARRIEHRVAGADANTYLVLAAILRAVLDGLSQKTDPPEPCDHQIEGPALPVGWVRTRDVFAQSPAMQSLMGEAHGLYVALRDQEMARIDAEMSELERKTLGSAL